MPKPTLVTWKIVGERPLFQSNPATAMWPEPEEDEKTKPATRKAPMYPGKAKAFDIAKTQLYVNGDGQNYHPGMAFYKCLQKACTKRNLDRSTALSIVVAAVRPIEDEFLLLDPTTLDSKKPKPIKPDAWLMDKRRAINHNKNKDTGGVAVVAVRPKWPMWGGLLTMEIDLDFFLKGNTVKLGGLTELLNIGGHIFGIGVGRRRLMGIRRMQEIWSDMGMGRFSAELLNGK